MQDIYKDLMLLEDEQEEQDKDLVLDMIDSLTHFYVEEEDETSRKVPWYCMLSDVASDFGYSDKEMMDFAKNNGYIVFKISPIGSFRGGLAIADKDVDLDMVKENVRKSVVDDFENEKDIPEVKISFEKERKVEESKLDDLKVSSYKYLLDVYDRDDNFIERKFFRSRPEADKFVDAMSDLFDIKISNNEVVELKDGKDFFGTYWKVIRELNKDESLKEDAKEIPWVMQQGENGELEYLGFAKSHNDMINKLVKSHSSDFIGENTYINELDKDTYLGMKKEGTIDEEDIKLLDSYFNVKESLREDTDTELVGKPIKFKDESCEITEVKEEDDDAFISLSNGKKVSAKIGVNRGILSSEDAFVQAYLDTFKEDEAEEPEEEPTVKVDSKEEIINQALEDAREDWYKHKKNSPMYKTITQAFKKNDFSNVPSADPVLYATTYKKEFERLKDSVEGKLAKNYVGVIEKTYKGDVDELIAWLKDAVTNISVTSGDAMTNSVEDRVKFFNDRDSTNVEVQYQDRKVWSSWKASLTDKEEVLSRMPKEVLTWSIDKNSGTTIDDVELGLVYNQRQNKITSNPVVLDMLYEYGFNLGKQKVQKSSSEVEEESLNEDADKYNLDDIFSKYSNKLNDKEKEFVKNHKDDKAWTVLYNSHDTIAKIPGTDKYAYNLTLDDALDCFLSYQLTNFGDFVEIRIDCSKDDLVSFGRKVRPYTSLSITPFTRYFEDNLNDDALIKTDINEQLNESNEEEVVEETNEYKIVKTIETIFKTVNGVARKDKDKVIYQVYFRTQDYNPAVGRWMNRGWTNSTSEHDSIESARAYVKRYGKTLKDELDEALEHPELYGKKVKIKVNNALSNTIDRTFGDNIIEKNVLGKNEIEYILPYDSMFEYIAKRFHKNYEVVECLEEDIEKIPSFTELDVEQRARANERVLNNLIKDVIIRRPSCKMQLAWNGPRNYGVLFYYAYGEKQAKDGIAFNDCKYILYGNNEDIKEAREEKFTKMSQEQVDRLQELLDKWFSDDEYNYDIVDAYINDRNNHIRVNALDYSMDTCGDDVSHDYYRTDFGDDEWEYIFKGRLEEDIEKHDELKESPTYANLTKVSDDVWKYKNTVEIQYNKKGKYYYVAEPDSLNWMYSTKLKDLITSVDRELDENLEEDIEKHDTLNQKLFDDEELKPVVAKAIMNIANEFVKELGEDGISFTLKDVILLGSNMSYNYTKDSDLDIHLIADSSALECPKELQDKLYSAYRTIFNKNYDITIKGIPAEVYVELDEPQAKSNGIYSLNSGWVKKPEQQAIPDLDKEAFDEFFKFWEDRYNELINNENATSKDVEEYINDIYDERKDGIANDGEYSLGNLLFKEVRNKGYLDNLKDLRKELKGKELSLEQLDNSTNDKYNNVDEKFVNKRYKRPVKEELRSDDDPRKLLRACGKFVYHATDKKHLKQIFKEGLHDFWFSYDPDLCEEFMFVNHDDYDDLCLIEIRTKELDPDKCNFKADSGDGWSNVWGGTGIYKGMVKKFRNIYDAENDYEEITDEELSKWIDENNIVFEHLNEDSKETKIRKKVNKLYRDSRGHHGGTYTIDYSKYSKEQLANKFVVAIKSLSHNWKMSYKDVPSTEFKNEVKEAIKRAKENNLDIVGTWMPTYVDECSVDVCKLFSNEYDANKFAYNQGESEYGVFDSEGSYGEGRKPIPPKEFNKIDKTQNSSYNKRVDYFKQENLRVKRR